MRILRAVFLLLGLLCVAAVGATRQHAHANRGRASRTRTASSSPLALFDAVQPRARVIIDNDFSGDADDLFALVQHVLSPSVDVRAVISSHINPGDSQDPSPTQAEDGARRVQQVFDAMRASATRPLLKLPPIFAGANQAMNNTFSPQATAATDAIIAECKRTDSALPLYITCGGSLTEVAAAVLLAPEIVGKFTLVWIGGSPYSDIDPTFGLLSGALDAVPAADSVEAGTAEYNMGLDIAAAQVIFNSTKVPIWHVPGNAYSQVLVSFATLEARVGVFGSVGPLLIDAVVNMTHLWSGENLGECYVLGDSPLVLLTALQSSWSADPSSSVSVMHRAPFVAADGSYVSNPNGRTIRVFTRLDTRVLLEDLFVKFARFFG